MEKTKRKTRGTGAPFYHSLVRDESRMACLMLNSIVSGICEKLNEAFGDGCTIYKEQVAQGLCEPCFFVQLVAHSAARQLGNRYFRENLFCIQYFPASKSESNSECADAQDRLYLALEYITASAGSSGGTGSSGGSDLWRGTEMRGEITDGILNFFVSFNSTVYKTVDNDPMEALENPNINVKGD